MIVNVNIFLGSNPFIDAYIHSDFLGKLIFIGLVALSIFSWVIMIHKIYVTYLVQKYSSQFQNFFSQQKINPLAIEVDQKTSINMPNPFLELYLVLKKQSVDLLNKNRRFGEGGASYLSPSDIDSIDSYLMHTISSMTKRLEKNLFILSTVVSLGPFLGLLGTVWGILTTFSDLQSQSGGNDMILGGLSLALATTVLGLIDAIPALIGYNYLKNTIHSYQVEMEGFSTEILSSVEMQYRKVDLS